MYFSMFPQANYDFSNGDTTKIVNIFRQIRTVEPKFNEALVYQDYIVNEQRPDQVSYELYGTPEYYWTFFIINEQLWKGYHSWPMTDKALQEFVISKYKDTYIHLYRDVTDPIDYNSIINNFPIGTQLTGSTSGAIATVTNRLVDTNQITVAYTTTTTFIQGEQILPGILNKYTILDGQFGIHHFEDANGNIITNVEHIQSTDIIPVTNMEFESRENENRKHIRVLRKQYIDEFILIFRRLING